MQQSKTHLTLIALSVTSTLLAVRVALATNGHVLHGIGAVNEALGGAGIATSIDAIGSNANNVSSIGFLERSDIEFGAGVFVPDRSYFASISGRGLQEPAVVQLFSLELGVSGWNADRLWLSARLSAHRRHRAELSTSRAAVGRRRREIDQLLRHHRFRQETLRRDAAGALCTGLWVEGHLDVFARHPVQSGSQTRLACRLQLRSTSSSSTSSPRRSSSTISPEGSASV